MSAAKHTPGPWIAKKGAGWIVTRPDAIARREAAIMVGMTPAVSLVGDPQAQWVEDGEAEANARLIAAAPELLAALEGMMNAEGAISKLLAFKMACAAIAKATKAQS